MTYKVYKANGTKCIKKFENIDEAHEWCWLKDNGNEYRIEFQYENEDTPRRIYV